jgi:hypothetical protein
MTAQFSETPSGDGVFSIIRGLIHIGWTSEPFHAGETSMIRPFCYLNVHRFLQGQATVALKEQYTFTKSAEYTTCLETSYLNVRHLAAEYLSASVDTKLCS